MGEITEKVKEYISAHERELQSLNIKTSAQNEIQEFNNLIIENYKIQSELNKSNLRIERLKEELSGVNPRDIELVDEYKKKIAEIENSEERQSLLEKKEENESKQKEVQNAIDIKNKEREEKIKVGTKEIDDKLRKALTMERAKIDQKIEYMKIRIQANLYNLKYFKHEYEKVGEDGVKVPVNGDEYANYLQIDEEYQEELRDLEEAKKICNDKLQEFIDKDNKEVEKINNILKRENQHKVKKEQKIEENKQEDLNVDEEQTKEVGKNQEIEETKVAEEQQEVVNEENDEPPIIEEQEASEVIKGEPTEKDSDDTKKKYEDMGYEFIEDISKDYENVNFTPQKIDEEYLKNQNIDYNPEKNTNKKIFIYISENKGVVEYKDNEENKKELSIASIFEEKKATYKRIGINRMCKECAGGTIKGLLLKRKINPEIVKILDSTGNSSMIKDYINKVNNKKKFPFELTHDLTKINMANKFRMQKYTRTEEKCGAIVVGKIWDKNKTLNPGKQNVEEIEKESKNKIAASVKEIIAKGKEEKENASFVQRVDGKNEEVAKKYNENSKVHDEEYENMPLQDLLNELEVSDTAKLTIVNYANKYGEKEAKEKYEKGLAPARARLSMKNFVNQAKEERKPGNQQIKENTEKSDDEGR